MNPRKRFWFKPKQFWKYFAAYYPVTVEGWAVTIITAALALTIFIHADSASHSASDAFFNAAPSGIVVLLIFDIISFRTGEYPSWWKKYHSRHE